MNQKPQSLIFLSVFLFFSSALLGSDTITREPGNFTRLEVTGKIRVEIYQSENPYVEILAEGTSPENILTEIKGEALSIRLKTNTEKEATIKILVYYSTLKSLKIGAQGLITSPETITGKSLSLEAITGGKMELKLAMEHLDALVKQGAILVLRGEVEKQVINVNTGSTYSAYELEAQDTDVKALSGGKAKVRAGRTLDATANLGGYVGYKGNPESSFIKENLGGEIEEFSEE